MSSLHGISDKMQRGKRKEEMKLKMNGQKSARTGRKKKAGGNARQNNSAVKSAVMCPE